MCALHTLPPLGKSDLGESGLPIPGALKSTRLIISASLACQSTSDSASVVIIFDLRLHSPCMCGVDSGGIDGVGIIHGLIGLCAGATPLGHHQCPPESSGLVSLEWHHSRCSGGKSMQSQQARRS